MRGVYTSITKIRRQVFAEIARMAYEGNLQEQLEEAPYKILPGEVAQYRESIFKERAIVGERLRLALGLPIRKVDKHSRLSQGIEAADVAERILQPPLVNVIPFACEACPTDAFYVTDNCRKCLAHPCTFVCPVKAVGLGKDRAHIDQEKCIKCGKCKEACPYNAIVRYDRPCAAACGVNAIESDYLGRAQINAEKCVSCGLCIVNCPFGAIADKSELFQVINALNRGDRVVVELAPSFVGQFGPLATPAKIVQGLKLLGFSDVVEVSLGADIASIHEAHVFLDNVPQHQPYLGTSCCPSWALMAEKFFPDQFANISSSHTPMVAAAKAIKERDPEARVVFTGPCVAKKNEALDDEVKPYIDFVLTFEELIAMWVAREIDLTALEEGADGAELTDSSSYGRNYANCGGVAAAITRNIQELEPGREVPVDRADNLSDCRKMLTLAKAGKRDGYLLEGMACPGGCVGGPGTLLATRQGSVKVQEFAKHSPYPTAFDNPKAKED
ncbi:[FeFe] hydrogenase (group B1/B3) [Hydrogenispora ethanolica]|uniref:[FeFe] hydrogenase (Group B1/B3) n=1 Tax=Hydrogenispora ethanolica TaxID=1082276 RepID=A0A4V2QD36_HYDET|nr:4Fe-4S dicluster domain-containing protein [Hydrogenispora ethanolica]TCL62287.1 [FeFe] hydrogenase (group B1/B3) [Hydrogenispora ethanolica]